MRSSPSCVFTVALKPFFSPIQRMLSNEKRVFSILFFKWFAFRSIVVLEDAYAYLGGFPDEDQ